ncbi:MAG: DUF4294 domain-containing protein [Dysgonamonadaceae bacterium]
MKFRVLFTLYILALTFFSAQQSVAQDNIRVPAEMYQGELIPSVWLREIYVYPPIQFTNDKQRMEFNRLVRDIKKTLPYAQSVSRMIIETYEYMETLPDEKTKKKHLSSVQKYVMDTYKPKMRGLTKNQGKILVKLIDRECDSSSYEIIKSLVGSFKAGVYNAFASIFGNSLKKEYDPEGNDRLIERIVVQIQQGQL